MANDPFSAQQAIIPVSVEDIAFDIFDGKDDGDSIGYSVQILYDNDEIRQLTGDLVPHMTAAEITAIQAFAARMRAKAEAEFIP